jgi:hypothetical protein
MGGDFDPFFNAGVVGKLGTRAKVKVLGAPEMNKTEFSDMQLPVEFKKNRYSMGLKISSGNYARLHAKFGSNPKKWKGIVEVEVKHFKNNDYIALV